MTQHIQLFKLQLQKQTEVELNLDKIVIELSADLWFLIASWLDGEREGINEPCLIQKLLVFEESTST